MPPTPVTSTCWPGRANRRSCSIEVATSSCAFADAVQQVRTASTTMNRIIALLQDDAKESNQAAQAWLRAVVVDDEHVQPVVEPVQEGACFDARVQGPRRDGHDLGSQMLLDPAQKPPLVVIRQAGGIFQHQS